MLDSDSGEEGEPSPFSAETLELNEEMSYIERVRSVCSFMGCSHIADFELSYAKNWEQSNNPWKGKIKAYLKDFSCSPFGRLVV